MMKNAGIVDKIATERIGILLYLAEKRTLEKGEESKGLARRYVKLAREISSHYQISIPKRLKNRVCRGCGNFLIPGINCRVRLASSKGYAAYVCECGEEKHIFYKGNGTRTLHA